MGHIYAKGCLDSSFNGAVIEKISIFLEIAQISHTHKNRNLNRMNLMAVVTCKESRFSFLPVVSC